MSNITVNNQTVDLHVRIAASFFSRLSGWIGRTVNPNEGLLITPCKCIHTFGMKEPIDVVFLNSSNEVVYIVTDLKPYSMTPTVRLSSSVLELKAGVVWREGMQIGDKLQFVDSYSV